MDFSCFTLESMHRSALHNHRELIGGQRRDRCIHIHQSMCCWATVRPRVATLKASMILRIVWQVRDLVASGHEVLNLTIGDFDPKQYPIPKEIEEEVTKAYRDGYTNYPPADGALEQKRLMSCISATLVFDMDRMPSSLVLEPVRLCLRHLVCLSTRVRLRQVFYLRGTTLTMQN